VLPFHFRKLTGFIVAQAVSTAIDFLSLPAAGTITAADEKGAVAAACAALGKCQSVLAQLAAVDSAATFFNQRALVQQLVTESLLVPRTRRSGAKCIWQL
jgi:hypothetical protein